MVDPSLEACFAALASASDNLADCSPNPPPSWPHELSEPIEVDVRLSPTPSISEPDLSESDLSESGLSEPNISEPGSSEPTSLSETPSGLTLDESEPQVSSITPYTPFEPLRRPRGTMFASVLLLLAGVLTVGFIWVRHPEVFRGRNDGGGITGPLEGLVGRSKTKPATDPHCVAKLKLRDLPAPHEILVRLGNAPLLTRALPSGVRLELVATAPGHRPARLIVPAKATWDQSDDAKLLELKATLKPGMNARWPAAPEGELGGVGPEGRIRFSANASGTELWLVTGAGDAKLGSVVVPCRETAHILVVNTDNPTQRRRLTVEPGLLVAASRTGLGELSVFP